MRWLGQQERLHLLRQHQGHHRPPELQSQTALKQLTSTGHWPHYEATHAIHAFLLYATSKPIRFYYHWFPGFDYTHSGFVSTVFYFDKCFVYFRFCHFYVRAVRLFYTQNQILKYFKISNFCFLLLLSAHSSYLIYLIGCYIHILCTLHCIGDNKSWPHIEFAEK